MDVFCLITSDQLQSIIVLRKKENLYVGRDTEERFTILVPSVSSQLRKVVNGDFRIVQHG